MPKKTQASKKYRTCRDKVSQVEQKWVA